MCVVCVSVDGFWLIQYILWSGIPVQYCSPIHSNPGNLGNPPGSATATLDVTARSTPSHQLHQLSHDCIKSVTSAAAKLQTRVHGHASTNN